MQVGGTLHFELMAEEEDDNFSPGISSTDDQGNVTFRLSNISVISMLPKFNFQCSVNFTLI
jgi:hypothetical protein